MQVRQLPLAERQAQLDALAALRIEVFREWPYLYDGDPDYERDYLTVYARAPRSVVVLAEDAGRIVGAATVLPLVDQDAAFQAPFLASGFDPTEVFYFGESVLLSQWRGRGIGHLFFDAREAHVQSLGGFRWSAFSAVAREPGDPRRPPGWRALDGFWQARGYKRDATLKTSLGWRELGADQASAKTLCTWLRPIAP